MSQLLETLKKIASDVAATVEKYARKPSKGQTEFEWRTIGGEVGADGHRHGGHPVAIDSKGVMQTGKFAGKTMGEAFGKGKSPEKPDSSKPRIATFDELRAIGAGKVDPVTMKPREQPAIQPVTRPNESAKAGDQLGLFGESAAPKRDKAPELAPGGESKGRAQSLFDTKGPADQQMLFATDDATPADMVGGKKPEVYQPVVKPVEPPSKPKANKHGIKDFGEKIGGARKDTAVKIGPRIKPDNAPKDERVAWQRRYKVAEDANKPGEYFVVDERTSQPFGPGDIKNRNSFSSMLAKRLGQQGRKLSDFKNFASKEEAEAAVAQIEVNRNHDVRDIAKSGEPSNFAIYRKVSDKKRPVVKAGFKTREEAEQYMADNPSAVIEHQFPDWEDYSYLDSVKREGKDHRGGRDITDSDFQDVFNFRGGEFGEWQMNKDGQTALNHAYDALHDLADLLNLPPRAMSLDGKLAIAFGSRGTGGKHSAKAHYEPDKEVINLTKMKGAGSLAHEWFHALDHYVAQQVHGPDKKTGSKTDSLLSESLPYGDRHQGRSELVGAWRNLMNTINTREVTDKVTGNDKKYTYARETLNKSVDRLDTMLSDNKSYNKRFKPFTPEQQKEWDEAKEKVKSLDLGDKTSIDNLMGKGDEPLKAGRFNLSPSTYAPLQKLNELYKKATGRSFHTNDDNSHGKNLFWQIERVRLEADKIKQAEEGATLTKKTSTQFVNDAHTLDEYKSGDYYAKSVELAARAFQGYIYDKTEAKGKPSQYLNAQAHNKHYSFLTTQAGEPMRPFPEGKEREDINAAFDKLFSVLSHKEREDEKGKHVHLYSDNPHNIYRPALEV